MALISDFYQYIIFFFLNLSLSYISDYSLRHWGYKYIRYHMLHILQSPLKQKVWFVLLGYVKKTDMICAVVL